MIAKGLDFPSVTLVGVISADTPLYQPDFRSSERAFQLLSQVAGRAGRSRDGGRVIIQTYNPDHFSIRCAMKNDYLDLYPIRSITHNVSNILERIISIQQRSSKKCLLDGEAIMGNEDVRLTPGRYRLICLRGGLIQIWIMRKIVKGNLIQKRSVPAEGGGLT